MPAFLKNKLFESYLTRKYRIIWEKAVALLLELGVVQSGDKVILTKGDYVNVNGGTNTLKVVEVGGLIH